MSDGKQWPLLPVKYDPNGGSIMDASFAKVLDMRGWGHLTGRGALALGDDEAQRRQDALAEKIVDAINRDFK